MCYRCGCRRVGCAGCEWKCNCNQKTWGCFISNWCHSSYGNVEMACGFRQRYLCIQCRRVWKSKTTKYMYNNLNNNMSRCSNCQKYGLQIGDKFRPPKQNDLIGWNSIRAHDLEEYCPNFEEKERKRHKPIGERVFIADNSYYKIIDECENRLREKWNDKPKNNGMKKGWKKKLIHKNIIPSKHIDKLKNYDDIYGYGPGTNLYRSEWCKFNDIIYNSFEEYLKSLNIFEK